MSEMKDVPQLPIGNISLVKLPTENLDTGKCPVILSKGKRIGEQCGDKTWGEPKCSAHMNADKRKYGSSNPFLNLVPKTENVEVKKPFTIINQEEEEDEYEDVDEPEPEPQLDDIEEITISLKNVKAICLKIMRAK